MSNFLSPDKIKANNPFICLFASYHPVSETKINPFVILAHQLLKLVTCMESKYLPFIHHTPLNSLGSAVGTPFDAWFFRLVQVELIPMYPGY